MKGSGRWVVDFFFFFFSFGWLERHAQRQPDDSFFNIFHSSGGPAVWKWQRPSEAWSLLVWDGCISLRMGMCLNGHGVKDEQRKSPQGQPCKPEKPHIFVDGYHGPL